jgi:predicted lipoprotein with Yx(FWY)xxD motif
MKNRASSIALAAAFAALLAGCATMAPSPAKTVDGALVNDAGMTLYTFDRDVGGSGKSVCNGPCAANWPPLRATTDTPPNAAWQIVTRDDGTKQWAYQGKPLYTWVKDTKPGDRTGDGVNNAWRVARP